MDGLGFDLEKISQGLITGLAGYCRVRRCHAQFFFFSTHNKPPRRPLRRPLPSTTTTKTGSRAYFCFLTLPAYCVSQYAQLVCLGPHRHRPRYFTQTAAFPVSSRPRLSQTQAPVLAGLATALAWLGDHIISHPHRFPSRTRAISAFPIISFDSNNRPPPPRTTALDSNGGSRRRTNLPTSGRGHGLLDWRLPGFVVRIRFCLAVYVN
jgi:hypothetical protein